MGKIGADQHWPFRTWPAPHSSQGQHEIACSAADVEYSGIAARKNMRETAGQTFSPQGIEAQRKKMIQQVVTRGNAAEHLAHFPRGIRFVVRSCGTRAGEYASGTGWRHESLWFSIEPFENFCNHFRRNWTESFGASEFAAEDETQLAPASFLIRMHDFH